MTATVVKLILEMVGLATIIWFIVIAYQELKKLIKEKKDEQQQG